MTIYIASYTTAADFDCLMDDGGYDTPWDMAQGCIAAAGPDCDRVITKAKEMATEELIDMEELTEDDEIVWEETPDGIRGDVGVDPSIFLIIRELEEA